MTQDRRADHPTLTVAILARDEARHLADCFACVAWADERVVVVDRASRDATEAIARTRADRVLVREFDTFADQRNAAHALATGDWILWVDADERVTPELADEIRAAIGDSQGTYAGFRVPIRSVILGRPFSHSGTQDDAPLRLFRRDAGRWEGQVHEVVRLDGAVGRLSHCLRHETLPDLATFLRKLDFYTSLEARRLVQEGARCSPLDWSVRPVWTFLKLYCLKQGFRDGVEGFAFCALSGVSVAVRHWKHRELLRAGGGVP